MSVAAIGHQFESAGGHFNPTGQQHGFLNPRVHMPAISRISMHQQRHNCRWWTVLETLGHHPPFRELRRAPACDEIPMPPPKQHEHRLLHGIDWWRGIDPSPFNLARAL